MDILTLGEGRGVRSDSKALSTSQAPTLHTLPTVLLPDAPDLVARNYTMSLNVSVSPATLVLEPLSAKAFTSFGHVIENPRQASMRGEHNYAEPVQANQGTALKYVDISSIDNFYEAAPSRCKARAVMNMFLCSPRPLRSVQGRWGAKGGDDIALIADSKSVSPLSLFDLTLMERHPYTTQTFVPIGLASGDAETAYLVVVAPTLATGQHGEGMPDLSGLRAFVARGSQAVTYGVATWHAPMIVVGAKPISFVVIQCSNGVAKEDCEEIELIATERSGITIAVPPVSSMPKGPKL